MNLVFFSIVLCESNLTTNFMYMFDEKSFFCIRFVCKSTDVNQKKGNA